MRGHRQCKLDRNHNEIVAALRKLGVSVASLALLGDGIGDILCGWNGRNYYFEIKDPLQPLSKRKLTDAEWAVHADWKGQLKVIETWQEACQTMGIEAL
jgi:hypothetical protein